MYSTLKYATFTLIAFIFILWKVLKMCLDMNYNIVVVFSFFFDIFVIFLEINLFLRESRNIFMRSKYVIWVFLCFNPSLKFFSEFLEPRYIFRGLKYLSCVCWIYFELIKINLPLKTALIGTWR